MSSLSFIPIRRAQIDGPDQPLAVTDRLALDEEGVALDFDPVTGARRWHLGHGQVDPGGPGPEPGVKEVGDRIGTPGDDAHEHRRAALGDGDRIPPDVRIGEECRKRDREGVRYV
jgi:hypothetical protein